MREIVHVIEKNVLTPDPNDLYQLIKATRSQRANFVYDTGSVNHISVALDPPLASYTLGMLIRVLIKNTNTGAVVINAGAGVVPVRKMSGADVSSGDLPANGIATLAFDGTVFQLTNFGGAGPAIPPGSTVPPAQVYEVKIPYCVDTSTTPGIITANFSPAITVLHAGDELAVKLNNTAPGPTVMNINGALSINCLPNSGGEMLQGDMHAGSVVIFFFDGTNLYFAPDPVIDAQVQYPIGPGQHWTTVAQAMGVIGRKSIGPSGAVILKMTQNVFNGPIDILHPDGDRIAVKGTMIGPAPAWTEFAASGSDSTSLARDAANNLAMLRTRYGTEIHMDTGEGNRGLSNIGPGMVQFLDLLVVGNQVPMPPPPHLDQAGFLNWQGTSCYLNNVAFWGLQVGILNYGTCYAVNCSISGTFCAIQVQGWIAANGTYMFGSTSYGVAQLAGNSQFDQCIAKFCGFMGVRCNAGSLGYARSWSLNSGYLDEFANSGGAIYNSGSSFNTASPSPNTQGNNYGVIVSYAYPTSA